MPASILRIPDYGFVGTAIEGLHTNNTTTIGEHAFEGSNTLSWVTVDNPNVLIRDYAFANLCSQQCIIYSAGNLENWSPRSYMYSAQTMVRSKDHLWYCGWCGGNETSDNHLYWTLKENHLKINCASPVWIDHPEKQIIRVHNWYSNIVEMPINKLTINHVDTIGGGVFRNIDDLQLVDIQSGTRYISSSSFRDNDNLQTVYLPPSVERINSYAFYNCPLLTDVYFNGNQQQWNSVTKASNWKPNATKVHWHCTVTFNANGHGTAPEPQNIEWSNQDKATEPTAPTADGYNFLGWYTNAACTTPWNFDNIVTGDMTLYAKWEQVVVIVPGDVDGDGVVTSYDVTALYDFLLNSDESGIVNGDQDGDGVITASDITTVYSILLGSKKQ